MKKTMLLLTAAVTAAMLTFSSAAAETHRSIIICSECGAQLVREYREYSQPAFKNCSGFIPLTTITEIYEEGGCEHLK